MENDDQKNRNDANQIKPIQALRVDSVLGHVRILLEKVCDADATSHPFKAQVVQAATLSAHDPLLVYTFAIFILTGISSQVRPSTLRHGFASQGKPYARLFFCLRHCRRHRCTPHPLLEEKWDLGSQALITNIRDSFLHDWPRAGVNGCVDERYNSYTIQESNHVYSYCI